MANSYDLYSEVVIQRTNILDIGCGKGAVSIHLAREMACTVRGVDAIPEFVETAIHYAEKFGDSLTLVSPSPVHSISFITWLFFQVTLPSFQRCQVGIVEGEKDESHNFENQKSLFFNPTS